MSTYKNLLEKAIQGNISAIENLYKQYQPMIKRMSWHDGYFDEDLYQTLSISFLRAITGFGKSL